MEIVAIGATGHFVETILAEIAQIGDVLPVQIRVEFRAHVSTAGPILIAHTPHAHLPGLGTSIGGAKIGHGALWRRQILHPLLHLVG